MPHALACALLAAATLIAGGAHAESTAGRSTDPSARLSDMEAARLLVRAGRPEHARAFLEQAEPADEEERIERLFLLGRIEMQLGMPARAAERFEAILALQPGLARVRLELARAYYVTGVDDKARYHFGYSLADELPRTVEATVEGFLRRIDARKRWSVALSASMLPTTRRSDHDTVLIGGVPFRLNDDATSSSGAGTQLSAGASFSPVIDAGVRGVLAASVAGKLYEHSNWNEVTASGDFGVTRLFDWGSASGGVRIGRAWSGGDPDRKSLGPWIRIGRRLSGHTRVDVALSADHRRHDTRDGRDGWRMVASPRLAHALDGRTSVEVEPMLEVVAAQDDHHGSRLVGLAARVSSAFDGGLSASLSASAKVRRYAADDPLFGTRRADRTLRVGVRLLHRSLRHRGFAPWVGYSFERNLSTVPVHAHHSHGVSAGVTRKF